MMRPFDSLDLIVELPDPIVRIAGCNAVNQDETFTIPNPLISESCVLLLTCRIQDFEHASLTVDYHLLPIGVFYSWVICFHEVIKTELLGSISIRKALW